MASTTSRIDGAMGKIQAPRAPNSFKRSFWMVPAMRSFGDALLLGHRFVHREQDRRGSIDRERRGDLIQRNARRRSSPCRPSESMATPTLPTSPARLRRVRVVAELRRQIQRHRQPGLPALEQILEALIGLARACRSRRIAASSTPCRGTSRIDAAGKWIFAGLSELRAGSAGS